MLGPATPKSALRLAHDDPRGNQNADRSGYWAATANFVYLLLLSAITAARTRADIRYSPSHLGTSSSPTESLASAADGLAQAQLVAALALRTKTATLQYNLDRDERRARPLFLQRNFDTPHQASLPDPALQSAV